MIVLCAVVIAFETLLILGFIAREREHVKTVADLQLKVAAWRDAAAAWEVTALQDLQSPLRWHGREVRH